MANLLMQAVAEEGEHEVLWGSSAAFICPHG
jgi:hypothetical protein